jgi:crotonobetainyl-CoA:carnitine CoA-transferase CaiB-like acyl-CoA transferase
MLVQAMSGLMSITGEANGDPTKVGVAVIDVIAGLHASTGILAALRARDTQGIGQHVEIDLFTSALSGMANQSGAFAAAGVNPTRMGNHHPSIVPYGIFSAKDRDIAIAVGNDRQFAIFAKLLKIEDKNLERNENRVAKRDEVISLINSKLAEKSAHEWITLFREHEIPAGPINTIAEAFAFGQENGLQLIVKTGDESSVVNPIKLSETPAEYRNPSPPLS